MLSAKQYCISSLNKASIGYLMILRSRKIGFHKIPRNTEYVNEYLKRCNAVKGGHAFIRVYFFGNLLSLHSYSIHSNINPLYQQI